MKNICIVGSGHVGLVTGACLAQLGNKVTCMDDDFSKVEMLRQGIIPFYEPELEELVHQNMNNGRLSFTDTIQDGVGQADIVFICVGTPVSPDGKADLSCIEKAAKSIAKATDNYKIIVEKSTAPVMTGAWIERIVEYNNASASKFDVVINPEFLREGKAVYDFMHPERIVLGVESERAVNTMIELYKSIDAPIVVTNRETAELIKHASNSFLALKVSFINAIANICESVGGDVVKVAEGMGYDSRIGPGFLDAGVGYGGYCLPKDLAAFIKMSEDAGYDFELLKAVRQINNTQQELVVDKVRKALSKLNDKTIGILGLSYKPDTDDMREAPSIPVIKKLQREGAKIKVYDPKAMENARGILIDVRYCENPYDVAEGSDALVILTEWDDFRNIDLLRIRKLLSQPVIIDARNIFEPVSMKELGFIYQGVGR